MVADEITRLTEAIRAVAKISAARGATPQDDWQEVARTAFADADIPLTDAEFDRAWRALWKCSFMGGSYRQDAARVLRAVREVVPPAPTERTNQP